MKRNRSTLKEYFKKGAIPTDSNFADLIDSMLNQEEDNIDKLPNDPLSITAVGADESLINFYRMEQNEKKLSWQLGQKPGGKPGLSISDATASRLFIESGTGKVGIGTTTPKGELHVVGNLALGLDENNKKFTFHPRPNGNGDFLQITHDKPDGQWDWDQGITLKRGGDVGIGTVTPGAKLDVNGDTKIGGTLSVRGPLTIGSIQLGAFSDQEVDEWPNFIWYRDTARNWDEGLIKHSSERGKFGRAGFGIHLHQSREFGFFSTNWNPLFAVEGGSGNAYFKGNLQAGNSDIYFTKTDHTHTGIGNTDGYAAIENDGGRYDALMILGRAHQGGIRTVKLWDYLEVNGEFRVTGAQNILKVATFTLAIKNNSANGPGKWSVDYSSHRFTEIYTVFVSMHGFSLWNNEGNTDFSSWGHVESNEAVPQHAFARVTSYNTRQALGTAYCSESRASSEIDNTVLFTVVVMGRV